MSDTVLIKLSHGFSRHLHEDILSRESTKIGKKRQREILLLGPEETPDHTPGCLEVCVVMDTVQTTREVIFMRNQVERRKRASWWRAPGWQE